MKKILTHIIILFCCVLHNQTQAQGIVAAEYFFNTDPGIGNATAISIPQGNDITAQLSIPTVGLPVGFNNLFFRVLDDNGDWSIYAGGTIIVKAPNVSYPIFAGEFFFNNDPGIGNGMPFAFVANDSIITTLNIPTSGLTPGFNTLFIRIRDIADQWSIYAGGTIYVNAPRPSAPIDYAEYFFDTDPGVGFGTPLTFNPSNDTSITLQINTTTFSTGEYNLFFRVRDTTMTYSLYAGQKVRICDVAALANFSADTVCFGQSPTTFQNLSTGGDANTQYRWDFNGNGIIDTVHTGIIGSPGVPSQFQYMYQTGGLFNARLISDNGGGCSDTTIIPVWVKQYPALPKPSGPDQLCINSLNTAYSIPQVPDATSYYWQLVPANAGTIINIADTLISIDWDSLFVGTVNLYAGAFYGACDSISSAPLSAPLEIVISTLTNGGILTLQNTFICEGSLTGNITVTNYNGKVLHWEKRLSGSGQWIIIPDTNYIYSETPSSIGVWSYRARLQNGGCLAAYSTVGIITVLATPDTIGTITGTPLVCQGAQMVAYTIPPIPNATSYTWTSFPGASISGQGSNSILVNFSPISPSGSLTVFGSNICGQSPNSAPYHITVNPPPTVNISPWPDTLVPFLQTALLIGSATGSISPYTYNWTPSSLVATPNSPTTFTDSLQNSTIFTLNVTDSLGCQNSKQTSVIITGIPLTAWAFANPPIVCAGDNVVLTAIPNGGGAPYTFNWSSNPPGFSSNLQSPTVNPTATTVYTVTVSGGGQSTTAGITVNLNPVAGNAGPITGASSVCQGQNAVSYSVSPIPGASGYTWNLPNGATISSGSNTNTIVVNYGLNAISGHISVAGTNNCGTGAISPLFPITVNPLPIIDAGPDQSIALGNSTSFTPNVQGGSGNYAYVWSPSSLLVNPNVQNAQTIGLTNSATFTVTVTDNVSMCKSTDQLLVLVLGFPLSVSTSSVPAIICAGETSQISALPNGGTGIYAFAWSSNPGTFTSSNQNPIVTPTITTTYTVTVTSGSQTATSNVVVSVSPLPSQIGSISGPSSVCRGDVGVAFSVPNVPHANVYHWQLPPDATILSGMGTSTILVNFSLSANSGSIWVYTSNFCGLGDTAIPYPIIVNPLPIVDAGQDIITGSGIANLQGSVSGGSGAFIYSWHPSVLLNDSSILNPTTNNLSSSQTFTLTATDTIFGCSQSDQMQVIISGGPLSATAIATPPMVCANSMTQLNALPQGGSGIFTYEWSSNPSGFTSFIKNPNAYPSVTTEYIVTVTDATTQLFMTTSIIVSVNPLPDTAGVIVGSSQVCQGENGVLYTVPLIPNATGYNWYLPTGVVIASGQNTNAITVNYLSSATAGNISVAGTNFCGQGTISQGIPVHVDSLPSIVIGSTQYVSQNTMAQLTAMATGGSGNFSYAWTPVNKLNNPNIPNPTTTPLISSEVFTLTVTDLVTGCINTAQVQVIVTGINLSIFATADPQTICETGSANLYSLPTGGVGVYNYSWTSNPSGFTSNLQNPTVSPTTTTQYIVTVDDGSQTASHAVTVNVNALPGTPSSISGTTSVCRGTNNVIYAISPIPGATSYVWTLPTGATITSGVGFNSINVSFSPSAVSGQISVYGVNACGNGNTATINITVNALPLANAGADHYISSGSSINLQGSATGGSGSYSYSWAPGNLLLPNNSTLQNPATHALSNPTTFTLSVTDNVTSCIGTDQVQVYILGGPLTAVAHASPNIICQGQQSQLNVLPNGGIGIYQYSWASSPSGFTSTIQNPLVSPTVTTTYHVTVTSDTIFTTSVVVTVSPLPIAAQAVAGTSPVCQGTTGIIYSIPTIPGATSYLWSLPAGATIVSGNSTNSITVNFGLNAVSGVIKASGGNICGQGPFSPDFNVQVNQAPLVNAGNDTTISYNQIAYLAGSFTGGIGPFHHQWTPFNYFIPISTSYPLITQTINLINSVTFTLTVTDSATGCIGNDMKNVYISGGGPVSVSAVAMPNTICQGDSSQLTSLPSGGTGNYQYTWTSIPSGFSSNIQNPTVAPTVTTQFIVEVNDGATIATHNITVYVNPLPLAPDTLIGPSLVCQNEMGVQFSVNPIPNASGYLWTMPSGATIVSAQSSNSVYVNFSSTAASGNITVQPYNSCGMGPVSQVFPLQVSLAPFAYSNANLYIPYNTSTQLHGHAINGSGSFAYAWTPANLLQNANEQNPFTTNLTQSTYFNLLVTDNNTLCQSTAQVQIIVYLGPSFTVSATSNLYSICSGQSVHLNALPTGGNGQYAYKWTPSTGLNNDTIYNPTATPTVTTVYTVQVISGTQTTTSSLIINVNPYPGNASTITGSNSVCKGETGVLFSVPPIANATNYHWTLPFGATIVSGYNTHSIMVNFANNATSGNISVYAGNSCGYGQASPNFYVTVNALPVVYAGPDQFILPGSNANLNGSITGGSGNYSYYWTPGNLTLDSTQLLTATMILNTSKIFTLYATDSLTGCQNSDYTKVIVCGGTLNISAFASPNSICEGNTTHLDALPGGGSCSTYVYSWVSNPTGFTSSIVNPLINPSITTTYTVTLNDGNQTATSSVVVYVQPLVVPAGPITGPQILCQNAGTVTYSVAPIYGAISYNWVFPQGTQIVSNPDSNVVVVLYTDSAQSGFASVYGSNFCGFGTNSPLFPIIVKPLPGPAGIISGPSYLSKDNNIVTFSVAPIPGTVSYTWILPYGVNILQGHGTNSITVEFTDDAKSGFVSVYGINSCGTGMSSNQHLVTIITSLAELYNINLKIFPNPTDGMLNIVFDDDFSMSFNVHIYNVFGKLVHENHISKTHNLLDLKSLPNGMYYLVLHNKEMKLVEKFIIVK